MILTTRGRYAVTAIIDLCEMLESNPVKKTVRLESIAKRQNISLAYLEQIFSNLKKSGIVGSQKGPGGGYFLQREPKDVTISDIICATGENIKMTSCSIGSDAGCGSKKVELGSKCKTHKLWKGLEKNIYGYLGSISILDIHNNDYA